MTVSTALESYWRGRRSRPVNFDASDHVATAVGTVLRRPATTPTERRAYVLLAHWGYGTAVSFAYPPLRRAMSRGGSPTPTALATAGLFTAATQLMAWSLFPTVGATPPPWQWSAATTASSITHHGVYSVTVATVWGRGPFSRDPARP